MMKTGYKLSPEARVSKGETSKSLQSQPVRVLEGLTVCTDIETNPRETKKKVIKGVNGKQEETP